MFLTGDVQLLLFFFLEVKDFQGVSWFPRGATITLKNLGAHNVRLRWALREVLHREKSSVSMHA